mmetsp:Transcript_52800/g.113051  ORF Transcript_52800/g.113051 Transcript_52800/m.113051 type:complete len:248 (-) Transcript_52800:203-946(-)
MERRFSVFSNLFVFASNSKRFKWRTKTGGNFHRSIFLVASTFFLHRSQCQRSLPESSSSSRYLLMQSVTCDIFFVTGTERYKKGSKRREVCPHSEQVREDRSCPCKRSTSTDFERSRCRSQARAAAHSSSWEALSRSSSRSCSSVIGGGRVLTRLRSSCRPSRKKARNSCTSCCWLPSKRCGAKRARVLRRFRGLCGLLSDCQSARSKSANAAAISPPHPCGLLAFTSCLKSPLRKYAARGSRWQIH